MPSGGARSFASPPPPSFSVSIFVLLDPGFSHSVPQSPRLLCVAYSFVHKDTEVLNTRVPGPSPLKFKIFQSCDLLNEISQRMEMTRGTFGV